MKRENKNKPPLPPCHCQQCEREECLGVGKPLTLPDLLPLDLDLGAFDLAALDNGQNLDAFLQHECAGPRKAIAEAVVQNVETGAPIPRKVLRLARAELARLR